MSIRVKKVTTLSKNKETELEGVHENQAAIVGNKSGVVSESYFLGDVTTMPLLYLEGEMQQREFYKPGVSMAAINILEETDPNLIKKYLTGFIDLPTTLLNGSSTQEKGESVCIDLTGSVPSKVVNIGAEGTSWFVREVNVSSPKMVYSSKIKEEGPKFIKEDTEVCETAMVSNVVDSSYSSMDKLIEEFSLELEKQLMENGHSADILLEEDTDFEAILRSFKEEQEGGRKDEPELVGTHLIDSDYNYVVEDVLLIYNNGTLISHARRESNVDIDDDIFSAMLTAVKAFIKDSFGRGNGGGLKRMDFDKNKVMIEHGQNVFLTAVLHGGEPLHLPLCMMEVLKDVEEKYGSTLDGWDGNLVKLDGINEIIEKLLSVTDEMTDDIKGFESGIVTSTLKLIEKAEKAGISASSSEIFLQDITKAMEREGFGNAWNHLKRTEHELTENLNEKGIWGYKGGEIGSGIRVAESQLTGELGAFDLECETETPELEYVINGIVGMMDELDSEMRGSEEERARLREMIKEIEEKALYFGGGTNATEEDKAQLMGIVRFVEDKMNELKMEKLDEEMEKAEMEGAIKAIEDKMTDLEISQIGTDAERTELKRMMDGIEDKILEMESENIESEVAKAELEGMIKGIEDKMTELEISQVGTDAERTELKRMMDVLTEKISELDGKKAEAEEIQSKTQGMMRDMETKMAELEDKVQGTWEMMEEIEGEVEVKRIMVEYIQDLEDKEELESLCSEVGLSRSGSEKELKKRLLDYVNGGEEGVKVQSRTEDQRFTRENIENIRTKAELVALCEEAGLKKSGKKEEIRNRLLKYVEDRESEAKAKKLKEQRFTKEYIESIGTKAELVALCEEAGLKKSGTKDELRSRLLQYVKETREVKKSNTIGTKSQFKIEGADKLTYAVLGDMYNQIAMELGDNVSEYMKELEGFIRSVLETREEMGMKSDDTLKSVVIKPNNEKMGEILNKLKTQFLTKVNAEELEVVEPGQEWEGIKLEMEIERDMIATAFTTQATKIHMLLNLQSPQKIKNILKEKGEYTLGVEGYPVTIVPEMLRFKTVTPDNIKIKDLEGGTVYINKEFIKKVDSEDELPPPPEPEEEDIPGEPKPPQNIPKPPKPKQPDVSKGDSRSWKQPPPPPSGYNEEKPLSKKRGRFLGRLKRRFKK
ncbi:MAG: hypothetical protein JSW00_11975 [Thermoplasmata archaeon]|nr:MAG: hypothetical protein JSW00_11975 [Thermoplasmata archaeon]